MTDEILVITPIDHVEGLESRLAEIGDVTNLGNTDSEEVRQHIDGVGAIYTNPNKSDVYISDALMQEATQLDAICTASTGTTHIDTEAAANRGIEIISLKDETEILHEIPSTAEHAFGLMMCGVRKIPQAWDSVRGGNWDYEQFIGRQLDALTVGIIGYGRLGTMFADFCRPVAGEILAHDPYVEITDTSVEQVDLEELLSTSDVISLHVHVTDETREMLDAKSFDKMKSDVVLVNTSRGELVDETALISFLEENPDAYYATDVITDEVKDKHENEFKQWATADGQDQTVITPHIGGITREAKEIAWHHTADLLEEFFEQRN